MYTGYKKQLLEMNVTKERLITTLIKTNSTITRRLTDNFHPLVLYYHMKG